MIAATRHIASDLARLVRRPFPGASDANGPTATAAAEAPFDLQLRSAEAAFQLGEYVAAAMHLARVVEEARGYDDPARLGTTLNQLGVVECRLGRYAQAERSFKLAAAALERAMGRADPQVAEVLSNLASVYKTTGQYEPAHRLYDRVLSLCEAALRPKDPTVAWALDGLGDVRMAEGDHISALFAYRRSLAIKEEALGPCDWDVAVTLDKIAEFYLRQGRNNEAEPLLWRSVAIRGKALGERAPALAKYYSRLGHLYAAQRKFADAERLLRFSLALADAGGEIDEAVPCLNKLAEVCHGQAKFAQAEAIRSLTRSIAAGAPESKQGLRAFRPSLAHGRRPRIHLEAIS